MMKAKSVAVLILVLLASAVPGCDRWVEVSAGLYAPQAVGTGVDRVFIDREHGTAWVALTDDSLWVGPYVARPRDAWPAGCPGNIGSTRMEVLALARALALPSTRVRRPILVRDCPPDPAQVVLREDGRIGGSGTACSGAPMCIVLEPAAGMPSLPPSMKGYELYIWHGEDGAWVYALVSGTNRDKTWAEISADASTITAAGWVKITVRGEPALKSVLARLPAGTRVIWIGAGDPRAAPSLGAHLQLPPGPVVREIQRYGQRVGIRVSD
jgi:hypothetical protein